MKTPEVFCPVRDVLSKICDKWSVLVMYFLQMNGTLRFNELQKNIPDVSQKVLTQTLRRLEKMNLLVRKVYPEVPPRVEYSLTELGVSFMDKLNPVIAWVIENKEKVCIIK